jgi:hypothetical protein
LTLRPGALWRSVVCSTVCGIRLTGELAAAVAAVGDVVDGQADTIDCDRALEGEKARERLRRRDGEQPRLADALEACDRADAVDVAADEVAVEAVAGAQRLLEVDLARALEPARRREARRRDLDAEAVARRRRSRRRSCRRRRSRCCRRVRSTRRASRAEGRP